MKERKQYTKEFKEGAARLVTEQGRTVADAAKSLGVSPWTMSRWVRTAKSEGGEAFRGHGQRMPLEQENFELRQQVKQLEEERAILKNVWLRRRSQPRNESCWHKAGRMQQMYPASVV
ncbi:MAG: transposase [Acidobacteria bacterium]|nr:transposase [Acidobacteriota bacterium]